MKEIIRDMLKVLTKFAQAFTTPNKSEVRLVYQSEMFSADKVASPGSASNWKIFSYWKISKYLFLRENYLVSPGPDFDAAWYKTYYQDVANSNVHPFLHYLKSGRLEGRLPAPNRAARLDEILWMGADNLAVRKLTLLLSEQETSLRERHLALWYLARWYNYVGNVDKAYRFASALLQEKEKWERAYYPRFLLLIIDCAIKASKIAEAEAVLAIISELCPSLPEKHFAKVNLLQVQGRLTSQHWLNEINAVLALQQLDPVTMKDTVLSMASLQCHPTVLDREAALVSVIVPMYNASETIEYVLNCLNQQTWPNLEIIISDDRSIDNSTHLVQQWIEQHSGRKGRKWILLEAEQNGGAYAARNKGMAAAKGEFLTVNDADDWAHSQKIEKQVHAIVKESAAGSVSSMIRTLPDLSFYCWRIEERWIFRNVSSLMLHRPAFEKLGFWDEIKAGADTEYFYRVLKVLGKQSIAHALPDVPLSLQLVREGSLTQSTHTHMLTQFEGPRKWYLDAAFAWHEQFSANLFMPAALKKRPFFCPESLLSQEQKCDFFRVEDVVRASSFWDAAWYVQRYPELQAGGLDPLEHYLAKGFDEGKDPGPEFSLSGYRLAGNKGDDISLFSQLPGTSAPIHPEYPGERSVESAANILLVAHQAAHTVYGAERSFVDLATMLNLAGYNVYVLMPEAFNQDYVNDLAANCVELKFIPYGWWFESKAPCRITVDAIKAYAQSRDIAAFHINTLVVDEPIIAAKEAGLPFIVHVREDLPSDPALQNALLSTPASVHMRVANSGGKIICNSHYLKQSFNSVLPNDCAADITVIYNAIDIEKLKQIPLSQRQQLEVGIISSNVAKKGIYDFFEVAQRTLESKNIRFNVYGPLTSELSTCLSTFKLTNLAYQGYVADPYDALKRLDVVLSLSHFNESFGRTVAEAQAAGRIAIGYNRGALNELIETAKNGFLVPFQDYQSIVESLKQLALNPSIVATVSEAARRSAEQKFSYLNCSDKLTHIYQTLVER